jgi:predicted transcriptional regulator
MSAINPEILHQKIDALPETLLQEVDKYIDFLKDKLFKNTHAAENAAFSLIKKGKDDIDNNRLFSHEEARQKIAKYITNKNL